MSGGQSPQGKTVGTHSDCAESPDVDPVEIEIIKLWQGLTPEGKRQALEFARALAAQEKAGD